MSTNAALYLQRIRTYVEDFDPTLQESCMKAMKSLRKEHKMSYKWIWYALTIKERETWEKHGFGLLFVPGYHAQIDKIIEREEKKEVPTWDWFEQDMDEE